jgi:hypothetical protein
MRGLRAQVEALLAADPTAASRSPGDARFWSATVRWATKPR